MTKMHFFTVRYLKCYRICIICKACLLHLLLNCVLFLHYLLWPAFGYGIIFSSNIRLYEYRFFVAKPDEKNLSNNSTIQYHYYENP